MKSKQEALTAARGEFERWDALLSSLNEAQISDPQLDEGWSLKDVVAHLRAWQQRSIARFEAAQRGGEPNYPDWPNQLDPEMEGEPDALNSWLYQQSRDKSWATVYGEWRDGFARLLELGEATPENDLLEANKYSWLEGYALLDVLEGTYEHHKEHADNLEPVIANMRQQKG